MLGRLRASPAAKIAMSAINIAGNKVTEAIHHRFVGLDDLHAKLKGVVALAQETVLMGDVNKHAVVLGEMPDADNTSFDVHLFVQSLLKQAAILLDAPKASAVAGVSKALPASVTHVIKTVKGQKVLTRVRYACGHCGWHQD